MKREFEKKVIERGQKATADVGKDVLTNRVKFYSTSTGKVTDTEAAFNFCAQISKCSLLYGLLY